MLSGYESEYEDASCDWNGTKYNWTGYEDVGWCMSDLNEFAGYFNSPGACLDACLEIFNGTIIIDCCAHSPLPHCSISPFP